MFLAKLRQTNPSLLRYAFWAHQRGDILPDTYLLDLDAIMENGEKMVRAARKEHISLYFMLKQIGRNPLVAKALTDLGFDGCVAVDYREALLMIEHGIPLGNVGHLVQVPFHALRTVLAARPKAVTVYTREMIRAVDLAAEEAGVVQPLLLRISDADALHYSGQAGGFSSSELDSLADLLDSLGHVTLGGFTTFPALLYDEERGAIAPTANINGLNRAMDFARRRGLKDLNINMPSATCVSSIPLIRALGGTSGEPGHGLTGTTPLHRDTDQPERVGYAYVSEVSHGLASRSYCYGGGYYRRGNAARALVGTSFEDCREVNVTPPDDDSIDYHFELDRSCRVGDTVVLCFRTQIFTTRSEVAVVRGLSSSHPEIAGRYTALGRESERNWKG